MNSETETKTRCHCYEFLSDCPLKIQLTNAQELYNHMQFFDTTKLLVVDLRSKENFNNYHIKGSLNVPLEECTIEELVNFDESTFIAKHCHSKQHKTVFKARRRAMIILVAFEEAADQMLNNLPSLFTHGKEENCNKSLVNQEEITLKNAILLNKSMVSERHRYTYLCKSGMKKILDMYPYICEGSEISSSKDTTNFPSEIFEDCLYLGNAKAAANEDALRTLGITHVLNVTDNIPNYLEAHDNLDINYENIFIEDLEEVPINLYFEKAFDFIDQTLFNGESIIDSGINSSHQLVDDISSKRNYEDMNIQTLKLDLTEVSISEWQHCESKFNFERIDKQVHRLREQHPKHKILVHCAMGKSRSATMVMMYIMKKFMLPYKFAKSMVSTRRETVEVNRGFLDQLKSFELNDFKFSVESCDNDSDSTEGEEFILSEISKHS